MWKSRRKNASAFRVISAALVVATSVVGMPEVVEDGQTGYLVPPADVTALSGRLRLLILDPKRRRAMGAAGQERACNYFSVDRMVAEMAAIYDSLFPNPQDEPRGKNASL